MSRLLLAAILVVAQIVSTDVAWALPRTWTAASANDDWSTNGNWNATEPSNNFNDTAIFDGANFAAGDQPIFDYATRSVGGMEFNGTSAITLSSSAGGVLTVGGTGIVATGSGSYAISTNLALGANQTWTMSNTTAFNVSSVVSGTGTLQKSGTGTVVLGGTNTFVGNVTLNAGVVSISGDDDGLGNSANDLIFTGGTLESTSGTYSLDNTRAITVNAGGGTIDVDAGNLTFSSNNTGANILSGTGNLTKTGVGTLTLAGSGTNNFTGDFIASGGTTVLSKTGTTNNNLLGDLIINSGALVENGADGQIGNGSSTVRVNAGGIYDVRSFQEEATVWDIRGGLIRNTGGGEIWAGTGGFISSGDVTGTISSQIDLSESTSSFSTVTFNIGNGTQSTDLLISGQMVGTTPIIKTGLGVLELSRPTGNTYTGTTTVNQGILLVSNTSNSATGSGAVTVNGTGTLAGTGRIGGTVTIAGTGASGGTIAPGALSSGLSTVGTINIANNTTVNGTYQWQIQGGSGPGVYGASSATAITTPNLGMSTAGTSRDLINVTAGSLTFGNNAHVIIDDLFTGTDSFNENQYYSWLVGQGTATASVGTGITFNASSFAPIPPLGTFSLVANGNFVYLNYAPVPEPSTIFLGLGILAGGFFLRRRLRKTAQDRQA